MHFSLYSDYQVFIEQGCFVIYTFHPISKKKFGPFPLKELGPNFYSFNSKNSKGILNKHTVEFFM